MILTEREKLIIWEGLLGLFFDVEGIQSIEEITIGLDGLNREEVRELIERFMKDLKIGRYHPEFQKEMATGED